MTFDRAYFDPEYFEVGHVWRPDALPQGSWSLEARSDGTWTIILSPAPNWTINTAP